MKNFDFRLAAAIHDLKYLTTYGYETTLRVRQESDLIRLQVYYNSKTDLEFITYEVKCYSEIKSFKETKWCILEY